MAPTTVYTDGACSGNPGPGGWAWVVPDGPTGSGGEQHTTNQRMELLAVLEAARSLDGPLAVKSDSTYVVNCFRDRWWEGWIKRGWVNSQKKPVANRDLWEPLIDLYRSRDMTFEWVKGHSGDKWNDVADRLAVEAAAAYKPGSSSNSSPDLKSPVVADRSRTRQELDGHAIGVFGVRPPALGGYDETLTAAALRTRLAGVLAAKKSMHPDTVVVTGLGLGTEMLAAEAAIDSGVPFVVVLAFPGQESRWPLAARTRFDGLRLQATDVRTMQNKAPDSKAAAGAALARRDGWIRQNIEEAIVAWDGSDDVVGRAMRSLQDELGEEDVWVVHIGELP